MTQKQKDNYTDLVDREKELRRLKNSENAQIENTQEDSQTKSDIMDFRTYLTGLVKGKITDLEYESESPLLLYVKTERGDITVNVSDNGGYSRDNELVRLLEWKNIEDGRIGNLIGKEVTLKIEDSVMKRDCKCLDELDFSVYIPYNLDTVGKFHFYGDAVCRRLGLSYLENLHNSDTVDKIFVPILIGCITVSIFLIFTLFTIPLFSVIGSIAYVFPLLMTILFPLNLHIISDLHRIYKNYRQENTKI